MLDWTHHPEVESEEAWEQLKKADVTKDIDDIREAFEIYCRNTPTAELQAIEQRLRAEEMNLHLVAMEKELPSNKTNVDLQNNMDRTYSVVLQLSARSKRSKQMTSMLASSAEENFARLADCGFIVKSPIPVCFKCSCKGHRSAECTSDIIPEQSRKVIIICSNCGEEGHRLRVCPQPRKDDLCRNCGEPDTRQSTAKRRDDHERVIPATTVALEIISRVIVLNHAFLDVADATSQAIRSENVLSQWTLTMSMSLSSSSMRVRN